MMLFFPVTQAACLVHSLPGCRMMAEDAVPVVVHYTGSIPDSMQHGEYVGFSDDPTLSDPLLPQLVDARVSRQVSLRNARGRDFSLRYNGFALRRWPTSVRNFQDSSAVLRDYIPEVEALVSASMHANGAGNVRAVVVWDLCLRSSERVNEFQVAVQAANASAAGQSIDQLAPVPLAHIDF